MNQYLLGTLFARLGERAGVHARPQARQFTRDRREGAGGANLASRGGGLVLLHRSAVHRADSWSRRPEPGQQGPSTDAETPLLAHHVCHLGSSEPDPVFALAALLNLLCSVRVRAHEMSPIFDHQEFDVSFAARPGLGSPYGGLSEAASTNFWPQSRQR